MSYHYPPPPSYMPPVSPFPGTHGYYSPQYSAHTATPPPRGSSKAHTRRAGWADPPQYTYASPQGGMPQYFPSYPSPRSYSTPQRTPDYVPVYTEAEPKISTHSRHASHSSRPQPPPRKRPSPAKATPKTTEQDARRAGIPAGYSLKNWDPTEKPITLLGSVFDAHSLGKWIYETGSLGRTINKLTGLMPAKSSIPKYGSDSAERPSGLKLMMKGKALDGFGDTGSRYDVIDKGYMHKRKLKMTSDPKELTLGNCETVFSPGTVQLEVAFAREPGSVTTILARVVENFPFDLLLSRFFLDATRTLTDFRHRFVPCRFPRLKSAMSFNFIGGSSERFNATLGDGIPFRGFPDTGSNCNVMCLRWAISHGFEILSDEKHRGWISLPSGQYIPTVGQVHTTMTLPDGQVIPMIFEVVERAAVPVVLRDKVILDYNLYSNYPGSFSESDDEELNDELLHMDYIPWYANLVRRAKRHFVNTVSNGQNPQGQPPIVDGDELERQWNWNMEYENGKSASFEEWMNEYFRRESHEKKLCPNIALENRPLIQEIPDVMLDITGKQPWHPTQTNGNGGA